MFDPYKIREDFPMFFNKIKIMNKGLLIIMSGPSGVGKGTLRNKLFEKNDLNLPECWEIKLKNRL